MTEQQTTPQRRHRLRTWPGYFREVRSGRKTFEVRQNDRDFLVDDVLELVEFNPETTEETGEVEERRVSYILHGPGFGVQAGFCVMALELAE